MNTAEHNGERVNLDDCTQCVAVPGAMSVIDVINPKTGRTFYEGQTLEEVRARGAEYAQAVIMSTDDHRKARAAQQDVPVKWQVTTGETHWEMLEVLPPAMMQGNAFMVGEPGDHHAISGKPRFQAHFEIRGRFFVSDRAMTRDEFRAFLKDGGPLKVLAEHSTATPGTMTPAEIEAQQKLVSEAAKATDHYTEDELEAYAEEQRRKEQQPGA
jgi:hypothetical protein